MNPVAKVEFARYETRIAEALDRVGAGGGPALRRRVEQIEAA